MDKQKLAESCINLAKNIAKRYADKGYDYEECKSCAYALLVNAADKYDPNYGVKFTTYYVKSCYRSLLKHYSVGAINYPYYAKKRAACHSLSLDEYENIDLKDRRDTKYVSFPINLDGLTKNEQVVIKAKYWDNKFYREIGKEIGLSTQRISQLHKSALNKLRKRYAATYSESVANA